ncbi:MAG: carbohydrate porin [Endomicrobium sp.]|jgi:carbohydrate-selective porin OprB|nr:carbohydrate porin [Endomicrobium sp.]
MRKLATKILASALVIALLAPLKLIAQPVATPVDAAQALNIKVSGASAFVFQGTSKDNVWNPDDGSNTVVYVFDLRLKKSFENNGKVVVRFKGGRGHGLSQTVRTYANVNAVSDSTFNGELELAKVTELYYQQSCLNDKLTVSFGKLDFTSYFTGNRYSKDKNTQFITSIFSGDKIIEAPPERVALNLRYALCDKFDLSYAYSATRTEHVDADGLNAVQLTYKPSKKSNYKAYLWENNGGSYSCKNINKQSGNYGFGISADHEVNKIVGVFGRFSCKDSSVTTLNKAGDREIKPTLSWDLGLQVEGSAWSRKSDATGFAIGQMYGSSEFRNFDANYKNGAETEFELYYRIGVNRHLGITPAIQYFINPRGGNAPLSTNVFIAGIRTRFDF